jgi:hypothetical protein
MNQDTGAEYSGARRPVRQYSSVHEPSIGGYVLEAKLGQGGMGSVFVAHHPEAPGRKVALKVMHGNEAGTPERAARFEREIHALAATTAHPGIVKIFACGIEGTRPWYVMELVEGISLGKLAASPLDPRRAARILCDVADAIDHVHAHGVIHRDVKPDNIMVEADDRARVCDFGLARILESARLTRTGAMLGTPAFAAPELLGDGADRADARADVYGLGATLFYALVGRAPFEAATVVELLGKVVGEPAPRPGALRPGVPRELDAICARALARDPADRYPSAAALRRDLEHFLDGRALESAPSRGRALGRALRGRTTRLALLGLGLTLAVAAALGIASGLGARRARAAREAAASRVFAEAMAPAATAASIREGLALLRADEGSADRVPIVEERLRDKLLEDRVKALALRPIHDAPLESVVALGEAAIAAPSRVNLVGEVAGALAVGDALLDRRDALKGGDAAPAERLASLAYRLASVRLAANPHDGAASLLRASVALARAGAPRRPLGPGRLGVAAATADTVRADLAAASGLGGPAGARAAWLLVDLLACAPSDEAARAALARARAVAPGAPERETLERVLSTDRGSLAASLGALRRGERPREAATLLSRLFAQRGAPAALEHPELADPAASALDGTPRAADAFALLPLDRDRVAPAVAHSALGTMMKCSISEDERLLLDMGNVPELIEKRFAPVRASVEGDLARALSLAPASAPVLVACGEPIRRGLATAVFRVLASRQICDGGVLLAESFSSSARAASRGGLLRFAYGERWEPSPGLKGVAACEEFDQRLRADIASDALIAALLAGGGKEDDVRLARETVCGLRRLEELGEQPTLEPEERDRLAVGALLGLESWARLGGPAVLPFRARLRRLAFPAPVGPALARLDLERMIATTDATADPFRRQARLLFLAASEAAALAEAGTPEGLGLSTRLLERGVAWAREESLWASGGDVAAYEDSLIALANEFGSRDIFHSLGRTLEEAAPLKLLGPRPEDLKRATRRYEFRHPTEAAGDAGRR